MITDIRQVNTAIEVLKLDADDYLTLPLSSDTLIRAVAKGLQNGASKETLSGSRKWKPGCANRKTGSDRPPYQRRGPRSQNLMTVMMGTARCCWSACS